MLNLFRAEYGNYKFAYYFSLATIQQRFLSFFPSFFLSSEQDLHLTCLCTTVQYNSTSTWDESCCYM